MGRYVCWGLLLSLLACGCATTTHVDNGPSHSGGHYVDPAAPSQINTANIESYDIRGACQSMMGKMLANNLLSSDQRPPHVILDAKYFSNQSSSRINTNLLVDLLRSELFQASQGRMIFVGREYANMVEHERNLQADGVVGSGTTPQAALTLGADYRLGGRITDLAQGDAARLEKYTQITFEMIDLKTGQIVLSETYAFKKAQFYGTAYR